jgi:CheY-like chemotaxis protein
MKKGTLLLAEDDEIIRIMMTRFLEVSGYEVIPSADKNEAIENYKSVDGKVDMILTDMQMPLANDGIKLIENLREIGYNKPTILCSGSVESWHFNFFDAVIAKPIKHGDLLGIIESLLHLI